MVARTGLGNGKLSKRGGGPMHRSKGSSAESIIKLAQMSARIRSCASQDWHPPDC